MIADLFPTNGRRGGQWKDHRLVLDGIFWVLETGVSWRDLPERFGPWGTAYRRFRLWTEQGVWGQILNRLQVPRDADSDVDWDEFSLNGSEIPGHLPAAKARTKGARGSAG